MNPVHNGIEVSNLWDNDDLYTNFGSNDILLYHSASESDKWSVWTVSLKVYNCKEYMVLQ